MASVIPANSPAHRRLSTNCEDRWVGIARAPASAPWLEVAAVSLLGLVLLASAALEAGGQLLSAGLGLQALAAALVLPPLCLLGLHQAHGRFWLAPALGALLGLLMASRMLALEPPFAPTAGAFEVSLAFALLGLFSALLFSRLTLSPIRIALGCLLLLLMPDALARLGHPLLLGHYLLPAALWLYLAPPVRAYRVRVAWLGLLGVASLMHGALALLVAAIWAAHLLRQVLIDQELPAVALLPNLLAGVLLLWLCGTSEVALAKTLGSHVEARLEGGVLAVALLVVLALSAVASLLTRRHGPLLRPLLPLVSMALLLLVWALVLGGLGAERGERVFPLAPDLSLLTWPAAYVAGLLLVALVLRSESSALPPPVVPRQAEL